MALRESLLLHLIALHDMEEELAAPDDAHQSDEEHGVDADVEPRKKKPRGNKIEQKTRAIEEQEKKLALEQEKVRGMEAKRGTNKRDVQALSSARAKVEKLERSLTDLRQELQDAVQRASVLAEQEKKKLEKAAEREEESRNMSEAGVLQLVSIRLSYQSRFDNPSDKADKIWEHIHDEFMKLVEDDELPPGDGRSQTALEKRFNTELGEFRLWSATANRAIEHSGVPADEVEEKVRAHYRPTTSLFIKAGYYMRPMSVPPFQINSASAAKGGSKNNLRNLRLNEENDVEGDDEQLEEEAADGHDDEQEEEEGGAARQPSGASGKRARASTPGPSDGPGSSAGCSGGRSCAGSSAGSSAGGSAVGSRKPPPPLHIGGASGKSGKKKADKEALDVAAMYKAESEASREAYRKLAEEMQERHEKEGERQRQHEKEMASQHCRQQ